MPVASLPSPYGIGDFGPESYHFIDLLKQTKICIWQILPLNPLGFGNSPYQPYSSYAGDEIYISLDGLVEDGLLKRAKPFHPRSQKIDYEAVRTYKKEYLKKAFSNFKPNKKYRDFIEKPWVYPYAVFLTLKKANGMRCWNEWPKEQQDWILDRRFDLHPYTEDINYEMFLQYEFYCQWMKLKKYANKKGIQILGDIPFYVGIDSQDVWANRENFLLDKDGRPTFIAGVPPDYFSATGQRWGNPIYDWDYIKEHDFAFWYDRLSHCAEMFDVIRIDHFRAFDTYWKIPATCPTAVEGKWVEAPGYELFDTLLPKLTAEIVVEDLGELRPEVLTLRDHYNFKGMKVLQFTFNPYTGLTEGRQNRIIYTGTHDNQTLKGWFEALSQEEKTQARRRLTEKGYVEGDISWRFVRMAFDQPEDLVIVPMQDFLGLGDNARINSPGTLGSPNWEWKLKDLSAFEEKVPEIKALFRTKKENTGNIE